MGHRNKYVLTVQLIWEKKSWAWMLSSDGRGASHETPVVFRSLEKVTDWPQTQGDSICENTSLGLPSSSFSSLVLNSLIRAVFGQRKGSRFNQVVMNLLSCYWGKLLAKYTNTQHTNPFEVPFLSSPSKWSSLRSEELICLIIDQYLDETRAVDWGRQLFLLIGWVMNYKEVQ